MAIPLLAQTFRRRMDPRDTLDLYVQLSQGETLRDVLQAGETVTNFNVVLPPESYAAGLRLISEGEFAPRYDARVFAFLVYIDLPKQASPLFDGTGFLAPVELTFATNLSDREKQYTVVVRVVNK